MGPGGRAAPGGPAAPPPPPPPKPAAAPVAAATPPAAGGGGAGAGAGPAQRKTGPLRAVNPFMVQDPKQKARRLARALISDMLVYHPEKPQQRSRDGNFPQLFKDEIAKSWLGDIERVGQEMAET